MDELFELKIQLTNEYLRNGGTQLIEDPILLEDLIRFNKYDRKTHTPLLMAFMNTIYGDNMMEPFVAKDHMNEYNSFVQKDIFFDQTAIETEQQVDELFKKYEQTTDYIFRGQREASWRLYNTIQRSWILGKYENQYNFSTTLKQMTTNCLKKYQSEIEAQVGKSNIDTTNNLALLGFLQHHGCPTPLLDWTTSFFNALFFATDGVSENTSVKEIADYVSVYFLHKDNIELGGAAAIADFALDKLGAKMKTSMIKVLTDTEEEQIKMEKYFSGRNLIDRSRIDGSGLISHICKIDNLMSIPTRLMYYSDDGEYAGIVFSLLNSANIIEQQGAFVLNTTTFTPLEVVAFEEFGNGHESYKFSECYNINKKLVPYIKTKLNNLGITKEAIYPDEGIDTFNILSESLTN